VVINRRSDITEYLKVKNTATLEELCNKFGVSINTIRRDVDELDAQGVLNKVYGGVVLVGKNSVIPLNVREHELFEEKSRIGKAAAKLVNDNDVIIVDAGSTTYHLVEYLKNKNITIITNSVNVLNEALPFQNIKVIITGGTLLRETNSMVGKEVVEAFQKFNADISFVAATGVSLDKGLTNSSIAESNIKEAMLDSANNNVLMVDNTKFDKVSLINFSKLERVQTVITDKEVMENYEDYFIKNNIKLIIAE